MRYCWRRWGLMAGEPEVGRIIVEALRREGGEATAGRLIYA